jgi:predicted O-methyltransferase YrrM
MPSFLGRSLHYVRRPGLLIERLTERRMSRSAQRYYASRTQSQRDAERLQLLGTRGDIAALVEEARLLPTYQQLQSPTVHDDELAQIIRSQTTSLDDCITIYVLVRLWRPQVMVETGVFYGAMSAMILHAMERNGTGRLYSIDLPLEADGLKPSLRGGLVPESLRSRWTLILGDSRDELPRLLGGLGSIDAFNHDSLHTTRHMTWEYETAWPFLRPGGLLSSHDTLLTPSWKRFCRQYSGEIECAGQIYGLGVACKRS